MIQKIPTRNTQCGFGTPNLHPLSVPGQNQEDKLSSTQQNKRQTTPAANEGKKQIMLRAIFYCERGRAFLFPRNLFNMHVLVSKTHLIPHN